MDDDDAITPAYPSSPSDPPPYTAGGNSDDSIANLIQLAEASSASLPLTSYPSSSRYRTPARYGVKQDYSKKYHPVPIFRDIAKQGKQKEEEQQADRTAQILQNIILEFYRAIANKGDDIVALLIDKHLVTANTTGPDGETPLVVAVAVGNIRMVQELVDFGAEIDGFGDYEALQRTPLQVAASLGNITLVKLFMETYHADDSIIAPDGQLALRLASQNGHREITDYLPLRRGGGWARWKWHHARALRRAKKAGRNIYHFFKILLWEIPRFLVWTVPKELIFLRLKKFLRWAWENKAHFPEWCKDQVLETPARVKKGCTWIWGKVKKIPKAVKKGVKGVQKFIKYLFSFFTTRLPRALKIIGIWLWTGVQKLGGHLITILNRALSFIHTIIASAVNFFRGLTIKDIWNGFCSLLRSIFITFPQKLWSWLKDFNDMSYKVMKALFSWVGIGLWYIGKGLIFVILYVPRELGKMIMSLGSSIEKAFEEVLVWINPKR